MGKYVKLYNNVGGCSGNECGYVKWHLMWERMWCQSVGEYVSCAEFWESVSGNECGYVKCHLGHLMWDSMWCQSVGYM